jgi:hypothetical protein
MGLRYSIARDPLLKRVLKDIVGRPEHPSMRGILEMLAPTGISWTELETVPVPDLHRKADGRLREWMRAELPREAARTGLKRGKDASRLGIRGHVRVGARWRIDRRARGSSKFRSVVEQTLV